MFSFEFFCRFLKNKKNIDGFFRLEDLETGNQRKVIHFHCTTWPDFGVPQSPTAFLRFLNAVRASGALEQEGPAVVHCSAGIGRSGTFCLVDSCLVMVTPSSSSSSPPTLVLKFYFFVVAVVVFDTN